MWVIESLNVPQPMKLLEEGAVSRIATDFAHFGHRGRRVNNCDAIDFFGLLWLRTSHCGREQ
jgi:hypothetical protein